MEVRIPEVGEILVHRFRRRPGEIRAVVVSINKDPIEVTVQVEGKEYPSLSAAASAISESNQNGWVFWGLKKQQVGRRPRGE